MEFSADKITIKDLFSVGRKYTIPRYQREYSWEQSQLKDFLNDIVNNINFIERKTSNYFFGTVILVGDMVQHKFPLQIVDGQQRLTTFTIFLSVLSDLAKEYEKISNNIWKYVIGEDDNGDEYKILENLTASPYFDEKIQSRKQLGIVSEDLYDGSEEYRILKAYEFFMQELANVISRASSEAAIEKIEVIKLLRDQLISSEMIYICSPTEEDVNVIFENINSKGQKLFALDLIKNQIFSVEDKQVPLDQAKELWGQIKNNVNKGSIGIDVFYRHFWISNYSQSKKDDLYKKFLTTIDQNEYFNFLKKLRDSSKNYMFLIEPQFEMFDGHSISKGDFEEIKDFLNNVNKVFNITQARIFLLALYEQYMLGNVRFNRLKDCIQFIEEFHYIHNGVCKERNNKLENKYGKYARELRKGNGRKQINTTLEEFIEDFREMLPPKDTFIDAFIKLSYVKKPKTHKETLNNLISRYSIRKYEEILHKTGKYNKIGGSIEHIVPESSNDIAKNNIGNLLILEEEINREADSKTVSDKCNNYNESDYHSVKQFLEEYGANFSGENIRERAEVIGNRIYDAMVS
ncbi:DUF262 domain-containing protein [Streptococcus gallolyticus]|uniref:DUF262 domain-containing protein n=1 Tax=Streptococcus gallolyticus TaxID=315405 RepID=UPI003D6F5746